MKKIFSEIEEEIKKTAIFLAIYNFIFRVFHHHKWLLVSSGRYKAIDKNGVVFGEVTVLKLECAWCNKKKMIQVDVVYDTDLCNCENPKYVADKTLGKIFCNKCIKEK